MRDTSLPQRLNLAMAFFWAMLSAVAAHANPSIPWTPSLAARHALEMLADEAGLQLPVTQWPLPPGMNSGASSFRIGSVAAALTNFAAG